MRYEFSICDVFTDVRYGGNPLAVFPRAEGLSDDAMQRIAREFNFSESTFVLPPERGHTRRVRIFTPTMEVPFAGHPNIGTAFVLAHRGELGEIADTVKVVFEEAAGLVPVTIARGDHGRVRCELTAPQEVRLGHSISAERMAGVVGLTPGDIVTSTHAPREASVGLPFLIAELRDTEALARARPHVESMEALARDGLVPDVFVYVRTEGVGSGDGFDIRCRMFAPLDNVPEDPATGSANCALVGMLAQLHPDADIAMDYTIAQGVEMGRPSVLAARAVKAGGVVTEVAIGGACVSFAEGVIDVE